jgi:beta-lactamase regulating signal transducer with metallopeptidase domain
MGPASTDAGSPRALSDTPSGDKERGKAHTARLAGRSSDGTSRRPQVSISTLLLAGWAFGVLAAFAVAARRWRRLRGIVLKADDAPIALRYMADELSYRLGQSHAPQVKVSDDVDTPLVTRLFNPIIILPRLRFAGLSPGGQRMALCHELAHVRRHDLFLGLIPALAERVFFFHPLALYAAREYALWREAACDGLVIRALGAAPDDYARLLLDLGVSPGRTGLAAAGAPYSFSNLKRRLVMLGSPSVPPTFSRLAAAAALCASVAMLVPLQLVAAVEPVRPAPRADQFLEPERASQGEPHIERAPAQAPSDNRKGQSAKRRARAWDDGPRFILLRDGSDEAIWQGSSGDHARAKRHQRGDEPLLWFTRGDEEFVVREPKVIAEAERIWEPVGDLGGEMGALGGKMGALGGRQGEFGAKQGAFGAEQGILGARMGALGLKQAELALKRLQELENDEREEIEREQRNVDEQMRELSRQMEKLGEQMRQFEMPMKDLQREMEPLGKEMEKLGKQMEELAHRAKADMEALIERALKDGVAEKVQ